MAEYKLLTKDFGADALQTLKGYEKVGGYQGLRDAFKKFTPETLIAEVKTSNIRGRGGAGFPTGMKWSFLPKDVFPRYLCCNADESEPGCFKDRYLIDESPHQLIEGLLIASYALQVNTSFIYIRGEYHDQRLLLERAVEEARAGGYIGKNILGSGFDCDVIVHGGAGAYICGEETALIESLEGLRGQPRLKPPFPAIKGLYGQPTVVNNVETLCNMPHIVAARRRVVQGARHRKERRHEGVLLQRPYQSARQLRDATGDADPRTARRGVRRDVARAARSRRSSRAVGRCRCCCRSISICRST